MEMENNCKTIVYLTTNIKNKKIYVGVHDTVTPYVWDYYLGEGVYANKPSSIKHPKCPFHYAVKKYGFDAFVRSTIKVCDTRKEALAIEAFIVDENFIKRDDTYNVALGGGDPPRSDKPVFQYDLQGNFIQEFPTRLIAEKSIGLRSGICSAVKTKTICGGFLWADEKVDKLDVSKYLIVNQKVIIYAYNSDGTFYKKYPTISSFCKEQKVTLGPVQRAIATKTKVRGFYISLEKLNKFKKEFVKKSSSPVYQYNLDGTFVRKWNSCLEVQKYLSKGYSQISSKIRRGNPICGDYQWSREKFKSMPSVLKFNNKRKVGQYDKDGNLIRIFETVRECRKQFGNVSRVLSGKANHCKGFVFKYISS